MRRQALLDKAACHSEIIGSLGELELALSLVHARIVGRRLEPARRLAISAAAGPLRGVDDGRRARLAKYAALSARMDATRSAGKRGATGPSSA